MYPRSYKRIRPSMQTRTWCGTSSSTQHSVSWGAHAEEVGPRPPLGPRCRASKLTGGSYALMCPIHRGPTAGEEGRRNLNVDRKFSIPKRSHDSSWVCRGLGRAKPHSREHTIHTPGLKAILRHREVAFPVQKLSGPSQYTGKKDP